MSRMLARYEASVLLVLTLCVCLAGAWLVSLAVPLPTREEFNVARWEMRHLPDKWLYLAGRSLRGGLSESEEDERLGRFLVLSARVRELERTGETADAARLEELEHLLRERDALENETEAVIEGRLTGLLQEAGLDSSLPLFPNARWVFPPVDVEFDQPPRVLNVSPRDRIELVEQRPLRSGLPLREVVRLEDDVERDGSRSALAETVAGVATYPSIVAPRGDYEWLVDTVAHEWVHHYLFFKPLGQRAYADLELQTLNETVADLAGLELAALFVRRYPLSGDVTSQLSALLPQELAVDVGDVLRRLRLDVESLLALGKIEEAEALMEQRRQDLAEQGVFFRRINQAFFAFRNIYAGDPVSIDPIGEKVASLRERTGSVGAFLQAVSGITSSAELDALLTELNEQAP